MVLLAGATGCLDPTEAVVEISTDAACDGVDGTGITMGLLGQIEKEPYGTTTQACTDGGDIGSIVLLPTDENDEAFAFKVVTSLDGPVEKCVAPGYGPQCIVARRAMRFIAHRPFHVPVRMAQACAGVLCPVDQTCVDGTCRSPTVDPGTCDDSDGCEPEPGVTPPFVKQLGGKGNQMARHVAFRNGILVLAGNFDATIDLGGGPLESQGGQDAFLAAYTPAGAWRWSTSFGSAGLDEAISVAIDANSDVYLLASFSGSIDLGGGSIASAGASDLVLARYRSFGKLVWAQRLGGPGGDAPAKVATGADGNVYVAGSFTGTATFGDLQITSSGGSDGFVASFTRAGEVRWAKALGGKGADGAGGVGVDGDGNVYVGGFFEDESSLDGATSLVAVGTADAFITSFDADGGFRWAKSFGAKGRDLVLDITAGGKRVVVSGLLASEAKIDDTVLGAHNADGFVLSLDPQGDVDWAAVFGGKGADQAESVSLAADGSVVVGGEIFHGAAFDSSPPIEAGVRSPFVAVLEPDGKPRWSRAFPSPMYAGEPGVASTPEGDAYVAGWFVNELGLADPPIVSKGVEDAFLARIAPP